MPVQVSDSIALEGARLKLEVAAAKDATLPRPAFRSDFARMPSRAPPPDNPSAAAPLPDPEIDAYMRRRVAAIDFAAAPERDQQNAENTDVHARARDPGAYDQPLWMQFGVGARATDFARWAPRSAGGPGNTEGSEGVWVELFPNWAAIQPAVRRVGIMPLGQASVRNADVRSSAEMHRMRTQVEQGELCLFARRTGCMQM